MPLGRGTPPLLLLLVAPPPRPVSPDKEEGLGGLGEVIVAPSSPHLKHTRHCSLMRMLCWPFRLPFKASSLLPGGARKSPNTEDQLNC